MRQDTPDPPCPTCGRRPKQVRVGGSIARVCGCRATVLGPVTPPAFRRVPYVGPYADPSDPSSSAA